MLLSGANRLLAFGILCLGILLSQVAGAATFSILVDNDDNASTGCTVTTTGGAFAGVEYLVTTTVDTDVYPPVVIGLARQDCVGGGDFGTPVQLDPGGWPLGIGIGTSGYDVLETYFPTPTPDGRRRLGFILSDAGSSSDTLFTRNGVASGLPIILDLDAATAIPALTPSALFLLSCALAWLGLTFLRQHGVSALVIIAVLAAIAGGNAWAAFVLDGLISDWTGVPPAATDAIGDSPTGADLAAVFVKVDGLRIWVRADVKTDQAPRFTSDSHATWLAGSLVNFPITTFGNPPVTSIGMSNALPSGMSFVSSVGSNSARLSGTPANGSGAAGPYSISLTASNGVLPNATQTLTINVTDINLPPSFTGGPDDTVLENSGPRAVANWATAISKGASWENAQTVNFLITGNTNPTLFSAGPAVASDGTLSYTPATNQSGTATITLVAKDDGGVSNGGNDTSAAQSFAIHVTYVNRAPSATHLSAAETYTEHGTLDLTDIVVSDVDSANVTATLTLSNPLVGSLSTATAGAVTSTYDASSGVWTASGPLADVNWLLADVRFTPTPNFSGNFTLATSVSDGIAAPLTGSKPMTGLTDGTTVITSTGDALLDDGLCTLREAIIASNTNTPSGTKPGECAAGADAHAIMVPPGTHTFTGNNPTFSSTMTITCAGPGLTTIAGSGTVGLDFSTGSVTITDCAIDVRALDTLPPARVQLMGASGLTLRGALTNGGQITASSGLTIFAASINNNDTASISTPGILAMTTTGNIANAGEFSGGLQVTIITPGSFTNYGTLSEPEGTLYSDGSITIGAGSFTNNSDINAHGNITISAASLRNETLGGDTREWDRSSTGSDSRDSTNAYYSFPDNYEIQYWSKVWTDSQRYIGGVPEYKPQIIAGGTLTLQDFNLGTNVGAVLSGPTVTLLGNGGASFTDNRLELNQRNYRQTWEIYTHYIAGGPLTYDDHIRRNDDGGILQSTSEIGNIGAGVYANTLNAGGFTVVNQGSPFAP